MKADRAYTTRKLTDLKPYENNPRLNEAAVAPVRRSIEQFGFNVPLVIDKDNNIIAGHTRFRAAKDLGLLELPCVLATDLTPDEVKAFRLADNRTGELADWDLDKLRDELTALSDDGFDISELGWDEGALEALMNDSEPDALPASPLSGTDETAGRIILIYYNDNERQKWCELLGVDGAKVVYSVSDLPEA
jgi:ParB-like chromosome segregation protein Spo0J